MHCHIVPHLSPLQLVHEVARDELHRLIQVEPASQQQGSPLNGPSLYGPRKNNTEVGKLAASCRHGCLLAAASNTYRSDHMTDAAVI